MAPLYRLENLFELIIVKEKLFDSKH